MSIETANAHAIRFEGVALRSADGRQILHNIQLQITKGETTALLGRSGSGKTTLLRMINRLVEPTAGRVLVGERATTEWDPIVLRRSIGYVIQETGLFPHLDVERNVGMVPEIAGQTKEEIRGRAREMFKLVGLDYATFARRLPHQLSGGQRQRVGLARALAGEPSVLLLDEPFGALDPVGRAEMQDMFRGLFLPMKKTVVVVTHDLNEATYLASRIVMLDEGRIVADLLTQDFLHSDIPEVQAYVRAVRPGGVER